MNKKQQRARFIKIIAFLELMICTFVRFSNDKFALGADPQASCTYNTASVHTYVTRMLKSTVVSVNIICRETNKTLTHKGHHQGNNKTI